MTTNVITLSSETMLVGIILDSSVWQTIIDSNNKLCDTLVQAMKDSNTTNTQLVTEIHKVLDSTDIVINQMVQALKIDKELK